eukprot:COSAG06_NODE_36316_length_448_cov_3.249284_1_plen_63_part_01
MSADDLSIVTNRDAIMVNQEVRALLLYLSLVLRAFRSIYTVASLSSKLAVLDGRQWAGFAGDM